MSFSGNVFVETCKGTCDMHRIRSDNLKYVSGICFSYIFQRISAKTQ